jgi:UDP-2,4-diacetamido-2,4,6-trideoxy-beta-L-altropyranose hydrolase
MRWSDLTIGGAGSTTWELACLGVPAILIVLADNQAALASAVDRAGFARSAGWCKDLAPEQLASMLTELVQRPELRRAMGELGAKIVDGRGAERVATLLLAELGVQPRAASQVAELSLRPAEPADVHVLFAWANDADTRARSFSQALIPFEEHSAWFQRELINRESLLLIGEVPELGAIGQVRLVARKPDDAVISVGLAPEVRGRGLGARLIAAASKHYLQLHPACARVAAYVKPDNAASIAAFSRAGFSAPVPDRFGAHECLRMDYLRSEVSA